MMPTAPKPRSLLGYHRILSPSAAVRLSPLCLGSMSFGEAWKGGMGSCSKETSFEMMDLFFENGGNFIDTANFYQGEDSERWVGEWIKTRGNRDELVLATKYTMGYRGFGANEKIKSNFQGNHRKSLKHSLEASLVKLQTDYIDLLLVHMWDFTTSIPELMSSLHHQVVQGKVLYLGISNTPAWLVVKCNEHARQHGLTPFCVYQGQWSCAVRDFERDILPMCEAEDMGLMPWGALGRGMFRSKEEFQAEGRKALGPQDEAHRLLGAKLAELASKKGTKATSIALSYVLHKAPYVFPVIGGRKPEHLRENIDALSVELTDDEIDEIEQTNSFDIGYPMKFLFETAEQKYRTGMGASHIWQVTANTRIETVGKPQPIRPRQGEQHYG